MSYIITIYVKNKKILESPISLEKEGFRILFNFEEIYFYKKEGIPEEFLFDIIKIKGLRKKIENNEVIILNKIPEIVGEIKSINYQMALAS